MPLTLTKKFDSHLPIEADCLAPDRLATMQLAEIERLPLPLGNQQVPLAELFDLSGTAEDGRLRLVGDLSSVHHVGAGMQHGEIHVEGNIGRHCGSRMVGGRIEVSEDAGDWLAAEMRGGLIRVRGNVGDFAGSAYAGSQRGMLGGTILVMGSAGQQVGTRMRRGFLAVSGSVGDHFGANMLAGTLLAQGACGRYPGTGMRRGTIVLLDSQLPELLPTFSFACTGRPVAMNLIEQELERLDFSIRSDRSAYQYDLFRGDSLQLGKGEIFLRNSSQ